MYEETETGLENKRSALYLILQHKLFKNCLLVNGVIVLFRWIPLMGEVRGALVAHARSAANASNATGPPPIVLRDGRVISILRRLCSWVAASAAVCGVGCAARGFPLLTTSWQYFAGVQTEGFAAELEIQCQVA